MNVRLVLNLVVLALVTSSALGVVYTRHASRQLAVELGEFEEFRDQLIAEWSRLQLEQAWLADASHVESKAHSELGMGRPESTSILLIDR